MQADVRRRQSGLPDSVDHIERGHDAGAGLLEIEHDAVPEPLDRFPAVGHRGPLHDPVQALGETRGRFVAAFLGQSCVARDVEEAHRRRPLELAVQTRAGQRGLERGDDVRRPGVRLLRVVDGTERIFAGHGQFF